MVLLDGRVWGFCLFFFNPRNLCQPPLTWVASELSLQLVLSSLEALMTLYNIDLEQMVNLMRGLHCASLDFVFRAQYGVSGGVC